MSNREPIPPEVRQLVIERDDYACQLCGTLGSQAGEEATLHLHHRESPADGGSNDPSNLVTLCDDCHHHHHSTRRKEDEIQIDLDEYDISTTPADFKILDAIEEVAPATPGEIADEACISGVHARRRLYALAAAGVVAHGIDGQWNIADRVEEPARGQLPESPERAAQFARDDVIRRMRDAGMSHARIADIVGLDERTIPVAANRARAFDPPVPPSEGSDPDVADLARRLASIERQLDS
ncbi:HNH endonuclease [Natronoarchaeum sp. GCM10025703]|uniref:HNH endonuclease n=1 Tax=unclassified Natronoarchaeum TaxID=2620183 RepID=UPI003620D687